MASIKSESTVEVNADSPKSENTHKKPATTTQNARSTRRGGRFGGRGGRSGKNANNDRSIDGNRGSNSNYQWVCEGNGQLRGPDDIFNYKLAELNKPTYDLSPMDQTEKKFSGRSRLYLGNLHDVTEEQVKGLFKSFGEINELFINKEKNFGFIRFDYLASAENAKRELDGTLLNGRQLKIRLASGTARVKVKNLTPWVSNELLHLAFSVFGEIERCLVIVDDHGKSTGEGIVEFARKNSAINAIKRCGEGCFFLTSSLRPVIVESYDQVDSLEGLPEKSLMKKNHQYQQAREVGPRFASLGSFEHEYGTRWKQLHLLYKQKEIALKKELAMEEDKLEAQMQFAKFEHETEILREQLRARELDRDRQKREWEERERLAEEQRLRNEEKMRRQQEEMQLLMTRQDDDLRRRQQENTLFMQAHQLTSLLDQQEQAGPRNGASYTLSSTPDGDFDGNEANVGSNQMDPKKFMNLYDRNPRYRNMENFESHHATHNPWSDDSRDYDYQNKRRRYM